MNNIIYATRDSRLALKYAKTRRYWQFISGKNAFNLDCNGTVTQCAAGEIAIIPPLTADCAPENADIFVFTEAATLGFKAPTKARDDINGGFYHALLQAVTYFDNGDKLVLSALGGLIAAYAAASAQKKYSPVTELVRADIEANVNNAAYALDGYIKSLPLNYDYVRKLFKSEVGATPREYLLSLRMELAKTLILSDISNAYSRYSIGQISEMCGFSEPLYFSRVFKKYYGVSPSEYSE